MTRDAPSPALQTALTGACYCRRARRTSNRLVRFYDGRLAEHGLTVGQFSMLVTMASEEGMSLQQLADHLDMSQSALSRGLAPLERDGLIQSLPDPDDKRKRLLALSAAGWVRLEAAAASWQTAQAEIADKLDGADLDLDQILRGVSALGRATL